MATPKKKMFKSVKDCYCHRCGHEQPVEELYESYDPKSTDGYLPYCKTCCEDMCAEFLKKTKSIEASIYFTCAKADVPFMRVVMESTQKYIDECVTKSTSYFKMYMAQLKRATGEKGIKGFKPKTFFDTDVALGDIKKLQASDLALKQEVEDLKLSWGEQETYDDYAFLELKYDTYTENRALTPAMEQTIRYLCLAELEVRKAKDKNEDSSNAEKRVMGYFKALKMDDFTNDANKGVEERFIEKRIALIERTKPSDVYKDKALYADFQGFEKYAENHIKRPIKNMLLNQKEYRIKEDKPSKDGE